MMETEINKLWKPIKGFEGIYEFSNDGEVYSYPRKGTKGGYSYGYYNDEGYLMFDFYKNRIRHSKKIHQLVYETFVGPIPEGYDIHHKDGNKHNNFVGNLELIEHKKHCDLHGESKSKPVLQYTMNMELVAEYPSVNEAERKTKIKESQIINCCKNKPMFKSAGGFIWKYKEVA